MLRFLLLILIGLTLMVLRAAPLPQPNIRVEQGPNAQLAEKVQKLLDSMQRANGFAGATFAAILPDGHKIELATGMADIHHAVPMRSSHRMLSGSNGKTLFIAAALVLASEDIYSLDDKIEKYIGDEIWFHRLPNANSITMRMLMNHTSGLEEYYSLGDFMDCLSHSPSRSFTPLEIMEYVFDRKPLFVAGTDWGYADTNFIVLGYILEKINKKSMYQLVDEVALSAYGLTNTEPSIKRTFKNLAVGYGRKNSPFPFEGAMVKNGQLLFNPQFEWMGGGFISNVDDLAVWARHLYHFEKIDETLQKEMLKKVPATTGKDHAYGLGVQIRPSTHFGTSYGHSGWFPGYLTDAVYFPDKKLALAIQFNTDDLSKLKMVPYDYLLIFADALLYDTTP